MPVEFKAVAVFKREAVASVPATILRVPLVPATVPTWLSEGVLFGVVVFKIGALEPEPKLNVPLLIERTQGTVIKAEDTLFSKDQLALPVVAIMFVPPGLFAQLNRFVMTPLPPSVRV